MMMEGRGDLLRSSPLTLEGLWLVILFPEIHISTPVAYSGVTPVQPEHHLELLLNLPIQQWKGKVVNDFETGIFEKFPDLASLKEDLYKAGAIYASLSRSGSSLYGIFPEKPKLTGPVSRFMVWQGEA